MKILLIAIAVACATVSVSTQQPAANAGKFPTIADVFRPETFAARRARLSTLAPGGLVVLFGEKNPIDAWDEHANDPFFRVGPFRQEENFFYLTGLSFPDLAVVIDPASHEVTIYSPATSTAPGHADGGAELEAAVRRLGLHDPVPMAQLESDLESQIRSRPVYLLIRSDALTTAFNPQHVFAPFLPGAAPDTYWGDAHADVQEFAPLVDRSAGGIANDVLAAAVQKRGWRITRVDGSLGALRERIRDRQPVIVLLADRGAGYHYVVVTGWTGEAVVVHDPSWGPSRPIPDADFERLWRASNFWSMVILPPAAPLISGTPAEPAPSIENTDGSSVTLTCDARLARALSAIQAQGLDAADQLLDEVRDQCPQDAGPARELSGVRFAQHRWADAAALSREALRLDHADEYAIDVLGSSLFMEGDAAGALRAWNRIGRPRVNVVRIDGLQHSRYQTIADDVGIRANQLLTAEAFERTKRRLGELPGAVSTRLTLRPERDGFATVEVAIAEREAVPHGTAAWAVTAVQAGVDREATVTVPGFAGQGDSWSASWRWWANRPAVSIGFAAPRVHGWPGVWRVEGGWQSDAFSFVDAGVVSPDQVVQETRAHAALSVTDWLTGSLRYAISAGFDSWNGVPAGDTIQVAPRHDETRAIATGGSLEQHLFADRVSLAGTFTRWTPVSAGAPFSAAGATATVRSSAEPAGWILTGNAGAQWVGDAAPMGLWPGAGAGHAREPLLRAHPLLEDGIIDVTGSTVFGRTLAFGGVELQRWLERPALAHVAMAGFLDVARATRQAGVATTPGQFDLGLGVRVRMPGAAGLLRIDIAQGMRDRARALTVGIVK